MLQRKTHTLHRLLDIAAELFIAHRYEDVSVNRIARAARCSTATIYEIYGSKEGLLLEVMRERLLPPMAMVPEGPPGFRTLLQYIDGRLTVVYRAGHDGLVRTALRQPAAVGEMFARFARTSSDHHQAIAKSLVEASLVEGMLLPNSVDVVHDHIDAMINLPALKMLLLDAEALQPAEVVLHHLFKPLVSQQGAEMLERYLAERSTPPSAP